MPQLPTVIHVESITFQQIPLRIPLKYLPAIRSMWTPTARKFRPRLLELNTVAVYKSTTDRAVVL